MGLGYARILPAGTPRSDNPAKRRGAAGFVVGPGKVAISLRTVVPGRCAGSDRKLNPSSVAVPAAVVSDTLPLAPDPTTATTVVESNTVADWATTPPKRTVTLP